MQYHWNHGDNEASQRAQAHRCENAAQLRDALVDFIIFANAGHCRTNRINFQELQTNGQATIVDVNGVFLFWMAEGF